MAVDPHGVFHAWAERLWPFSRGPEHCMTCGDAFIEATYSDGYRRDGTKIVRRWQRCPRNGDRQPDVFEQYQQGRCTPPHPFVCVNEARAWSEHRPWWGACVHYSVAEDGHACWAKDGTQITGDPGVPGG